MGPTNCFRIFRISFERARGERGKKLEWIHKWMDGAMDV